MATSIVLELVDRVTRPVRRVQQALAGLGRRAGLDRLGASARRANAAIGTTIERAKGLGERMLWMGGLAAGAVWGVERLVSGVTDVGTAVQESAERLSVGTTWLQEWQAVGRKFGVGNDALVDGLKELSMRADEFVMTAGGPAAEAFGRLGIGVEELRKTGGDTAAMFDLVRSRLGSLENDAARQRVMDEIFGGQGAEQMVAMLGATREEVEAIMRAARERGEILTPEEIENSREYTRQMGSLRQSLFGIQRTVVGDLLPAITDWMDRMSELASVNREAVSERILEGIRETWRGIRLIGGAASWAADRVGGFGNLIAILAGVLAGRFLLSVAQSVMALLGFGKQLALFAVRSATMAIRGIVALTRVLLVFAARGVGMAATGLVALTRGLLGVAARAVPAAIAGIRALSLAMLTTPVGWIITGIAAVAGAAYLIYRNWDGIAAWFGGLWDDITAWFDQGIGGIMRDLASWSPAGLLLRAIDEVFELFGARPLSETGAEWIGTLVDGVSSSWQAITTWANERLEALGEIFGGFDLAEIGGAWIDGLKAGIGEQWEGLTGWLRGKLDSLTGWMPDWAREGLGIETPSVPQPSAPQAGAAVGSGTPMPAQGAARAEVGGELRIIVDGEGRPRVAEATPRGGMGFDVESGLLGVMP
ncbi:hypothetical protein [Halomonas sp. HG01]|uniref:hypothetical protein n=1 Tax=Halomonas sp. HG01 TaxID=1609967 RepID=UPI00156E88B7|nr:hypothetical protein [Halomonas sp. HG01]